MIRELWDVLRGLDVPPKLPSGISLEAARHGCASALYSKVPREAVDPADWSVLRALSFFHRARARHCREVLRRLAAEAPPPPWYVWKGAALLMLLPEYESSFESGDVDIAVQAGSLESWHELVTRLGAEITKRNEHNFQARFPGEVPIVLDVREEERMPPIELAAGVPIPTREPHLALMHAHARKHASLPAPKLRMLYDAWLLGSAWHDDLFPHLFPHANVGRASARPERAEAAPPSTTQHLAGHGCDILLEGPFDFDRSAIERSLPRLFPDPARPTATARLGLRLDPETHPYGIEERADRVVLWLRQPPPARETRRLIAALVQRACQTIGLLTLHCTVVARGGRAVAFLGSFGAGKTLTSLRMTMSGADMVAGDAALIEGTTVIGGTREVWLSEDARNRHFPHLDGRGDNNATGRGPRLDVAGAVRWAPLDAPPPSLAALIFVSAAPVADADAFLTPMPPDTAEMNLFRASGYRFDQILPSCSLALTELEPRTQRIWRIERCRALANAVPTFRASGSLDYLARAASGLLGV